MFPSLYVYPLRHNSPPRSLCISPFSRPPLSLSLSFSPHSLLVSGCPSRFVLQIEIQYKLIKSVFVKVFAHEKAVK